MHRGAHVDSVRAYYDANTRSFLRTGQSPTAIRRAVWSPDVVNRAQAFQAVDERLCLQVRRLGVEQPRVVDLGCGVGHSLLWLATQTPIEGIGITVSGEQAKLARKAFEGAQLASPLQCLEASYTALPESMREVDLAFAIESFVHAPSAEEFIAPVAARLRPGGVLMICDDFLTRPIEHGHPLLDDVRHGWLAPTLVTVSGLVQVAAAHGLLLEGDENLTPYLELARPRDRLLSVVVRAGRRLARPRHWLFRSWVGGVALQHALSSGLLNYRLLRFVKRTTPSDMTTR